MKNKAWQGLTITLMILILLVAGVWSTRQVAAQNPEMQQKVADIKLAASMNKQALAQYTWVEQDTISIKGEEKKQERFQVRLGPDGKNQKAALDPSPSGEESGGRLKRRIVEKKKEEYKDYADQIKALIQQYVPPDKEMLQQAYQQGNIMMGPAAGEPGEYRLVISNYIKQGDNMTLVIDKEQKDLLSVSIATYLSDPSDAVNVNVQFSRIPGGPNHVSGQTINGASKHLTIAVQNSDYQKL